MTASASGEEEVAKPMNPVIAAEEDEGDPVADDDELDFRRWSLRLVTTETGIEVGMCFGGNPNNADG